MADLTPMAGIHDVQLVAEVFPVGARVDGNAVGAFVDANGEEVLAPVGYSFIEESQLVTRLVYPVVADDVNAPDVLVKQKADADLSEAQVFLSGATFSVKTIAPNATEIRTTTGLVPKL